MRRPEIPLEPPAAALASESAALEGRSGVRGTPTFCVNGEKHRGDVTAASLVAALDRVPVLEES